MTPTSERVIYPELPDPLTPGDLQQLFGPSFDERQWAPTVVQAAASQVALLVQIKIFQSIGRFPLAAEVPRIVVEHVARRMDVEFESNQISPERTRYRRRQAIFKRLGVVSWGPEALALTKATMQRTAQARTDPADIINSAIDALIRHGFELPAIGTLRRLAGTAHSNVNAAQWNEVCGRLNAAQRAVLETLLVVDPKTQKSPFARLCANPGSPTRKNLTTLIDRYHWIRTLPDPKPAMQSVADSKISQWATKPSVSMRLNCGST